MSVVLMQEISKRKKNEVASVLEIINKLEIKDTIITADAMSCLKKITKAIDKKGADYELQLAVTDWFEHRKGWVNLQSVIEVERYRQDKNTGQ